MNYLSHQMLSGNDLFKETVKMPVSARRVINMLEIPCTKPVPELISKLSTAHFSYLYSDKALSSFTKGRGNLFPTQDTQFTLIATTHAVHFEHADPVFGTNFLIRTGYKIFLFIRKNPQYQCPSEDEYKRLDADGNVLPHLRDEGEALASVSFVQEFNPGQAREWIEGKYIHEQICLGPGDTLYVTSLLIVADTKSFL